MLCGAEIYALVQYQGKHNVYKSTEDTPWPSALAQVVRLIAPDPVGLVKKDLIPDMTAPCLR